LQAQAQPRPHHKTLSKKQKKDKQLQGREMWPFTRRYKIDKINKSQDVPDIWNSRKRLLKRLISFFQKLEGNYGFNGWVQCYQRNGSHKNQLEC
jgi:hypothetical protein